MTIPLICAECGRQFLRRGPRNKYCGKACVAAVNRKAYHASKHCASQPAHWLPKGPRRDGRSIKRDGYYGMPLEQQEREILRWLELGKTDEMIAEIIGLGRDTVRARVSRIMEKLGAVTRTHAVAMILKSEHASAIALSRASIESRELELA